MPKPINDNKEQIVLTFFLFFFSQFFFLFSSLVDMLNPCVLQVCGQSKGKVLSEPLLALLGVRGVDGGVLCFRRASGRECKEKINTETKQKTTTKIKSETEEDRVRGEARYSLTHND